MKRQTRKHNKKTRKYHRKRMGFFDRLRQYLSMLAL